MNKYLLDFKRDCFNIFEKYKLENIVWSQSIPIDHDITFEVKINSINNKEFNSIDDNLKNAWIEIFNIFGKYGNYFFLNNFGNNVIINLTRKCITVSEYDEYIF